MGFLEKEESGREREETAMFVEKRNMGFFFRKKCKEASYAYGEKKEVIFLESEEWWKEANHRFESLSFLVSFLSSFS